MEFFFIGFILILLLHSLPVFAGLGILAFLLTLYSSQEGYEILLNLFLDPYEKLTSNELLLPILLFTLASFFLSYSQAPRRSIRVFSFFSQKLFGRRSFSLVLMSILVMAFFTPLTGASGVSIIALGGLLYPILKEGGVEEELALGILTFSASLGLLLFPSIPVILYGIISQNEASIRELFIAGLLPSFLLVFFPAIYLWFKTKHLVYPKIYTFSEVLPDLKKFLIEMAILPILFILFFSGKLLISEIGLIALTYFFLLEVLIFREIPFKRLPFLFEEAFKLLGGIFLVIFFAMSFTSYLTYFQIPEKVFAFLQNFSI